MTELTDRERAILDFEKRTYQHSGTKEQDVRDRFAVSATRYYQELAALVRRPEALAYAPTTVRRLQRMRTHRAA